MVEIIMRFAKGVEAHVSLRVGTGSVEALTGALPFHSVVHRWGEEIYFDAPFHADREGDARADMEVGEVAYWPDGDAIALFFGPTPASVGDKPRAYSPCNLLGRVQGPIKRLGTVKDGSSVEVLMA